MVVTAVNEGVKNSFGSRVDSNASASSPASSGLHDDNEKLRNGLSFGNFSQYRIFNSDDRNLIYPVESATTITIDFSYSNKSKDVNGLSENFIIFKFFHCSTPLITCLVVNIRAPFPRLKYVTVSVSDINTLLPNSQPVLRDPISSSSGAIVSINKSSLSRDIISPSFYVLNKLFIHVYVLLVEHFAYVDIFIFYLSMKIYKLIWTCYFL